MTNRWIADPFPLPTMTEGPVDENGPPLRDWRRITSAFAEAVCGGLYYVRVEVGGVHAPFAIITTDLMNERPPVWSITRTVADHEVSIDVTGTVNWEGDMNWSAEGAAFGDVDDVQAFAAALRFVYEVAPQMVKHWQAR